MNTRRRKSTENAPFCPTELNKVDVSCLSVEIECLRRHIATVESTHSKSPSSRLTWNDLAGPNYSAPQVSSCATMPSSGTIAPLVSESVTCSEGHHLERPCPLSLEELPGSKQFGSEDVLGCHNDVY